MPLGLSDGNGNTTLTRTFLCHRSYKVSSWLKTFSTIPKIIIGNLLFIETVQEQLVLFMSKMILENYYLLSIFTLY